MNGWRKPMIWAFWLGTMATFLAAVAKVFFDTPVEESMGVIQKIFYIHLPIAINTFLACLVCFLASLGYLWQRKAWWDDLAAAAAKVAVVLCSGVLLTGMIWGRGAWGLWWTWSPRLTFSFMLWLLYVVYLLVRASVTAEQRRAVVSAVYGIVAFLDVPLVYFSSQLLVPKGSEDIHPSTISLAPSMKVTLALCFVPVVLLTAGLIIARYHLHRRERALARARASKHAADAGRDAIVPITGGPA